MPEIYGLLEERRCLFCGERGRAVCSRCLERLVKGLPGREGSCSRCGMPLICGSPGLCPCCRSLSPELEALCFCGFFSGELKELVLRFKKQGRWEYLSCLGELLYRRICGSGWENFLLVPVPPRKGKIRRGGWDQVALLVRELERRGMRSACLLERVDRTPQKSLDLGERRIHMEQSLRLRRAGPVPKDGKVPGNGGGLLLLDDIYTSGATLGAAACLLSRSFTVPVRAAVLCVVL